MAFVLLQSRPLVWTIWEAHFMVIKLFLNSSTHSTPPKIKSLNPSGNKNHTKRTSVSLREDFLTSNQGPCLSINRLTERESKLPSFICCFKSFICPILRRLGHCVSRWHLAAWNLNTSNDIYTNWHYAMLLTFVFKTPCANKYDHLICESLWHLG